MSAHLSPLEKNVLLSRKLEQGIGARQWVEVFAHVAECADCQDALQEARNQAMQLSHIIEWVPAHLDFEQLAAYVADQLDEVEREIAANHLAVCDFCAHEVWELTVLQRELGMDRLPLQPPAQLTWWRQFKQKLAFWESKLTWKPAFAFVTLLLFTTLGGWWWQRRTTELATVPQPTPNPAPISNTALPGDRLPPEFVSKSAENLLSLNDNGQLIALRPDGSLATERGLPAAYQQLLAATLSQERLALPPMLRSLHQVPRTLKGDEASSTHFSLIFPLSVVLRSDRPQFRWQAVTGASGYVVKVFDQDFNTIQTSELLVQTQWRAAQALPRGRMLLWQVTAKIGDKQITAPSVPAPEARFQILGAKPNAELHQAEREFPNSHLLLGTLYSQAGLLEDAAREFQALQAENPHSPVVQKLLQQLRQTIRTGK